MPYALLDFESLYHLENGGRVGQCPRDILLAETDHPGLVHHQDGAKPGAAFFIPQTIRPGRFAFRMPVREFRIRNPTQRYAPGLVRWNMVTTDAQYLSIELLEPAMIAPEQDGLLGSPTGKIQHVKRQDHMLCAAKLAQRNIAITS